MRARWFLSLSLLILAGIASSLRSQQAPSLVAEPGRTIRDSRGGGGKAFKIESAILGETRQINIALPPSYSQSSTERRYPVTIVLDGEAYLAPAAAVSEELTRHGLIPEAIIVAIENIDPMRGRVRDLTPPGLSVSGSTRNERGELFLDFIERELLPAVDRQFRGAAPRTLVGHSSGGILATYAAATRSTYRAVIAIDAPIHLGGNWLAKKLTERAAARAGPLRYIYYEARFPWPEDAWKTLVATAPASWTLHQEKLTNEGHETVFMLAAYLGLREAFSDYSRLAAPFGPTTRILPYYQTVSRSFGATLIPPRRLVRDVVDDFLMEGRGAAARDAYKLLVSAYGAPSDSAALLRQIAEVERRPPPTETVEGLLATPFPTPDEARPYVGEWVGDIWLSPDEPRTGGETLRIRVVDGRVVGETVRRENGREIAQRWEYMRITPGGMTWGNMNGMRPRGVMLFEGKLNGDKLAGASRWGGIDFRLPDGSRPRELQFSFRRVRP